MRENIYCGRQEASTAGPGQVWRNGRPFTHHRSLKVRNHSPDGFSWGYGGSGPAQLALALLLDVTKSTRAAQDWYQHFKRQVVSRLSDSWVLTQGDIERWYRDAKPSYENEGKEEHETTQENPSQLAGERPLSATSPGTGHGIPVLEKGDLGGG